MSSTVKPDVVFVLGAPGAGKGTQCENIAKVRQVMLLPVHAPMQYNSTLSRSKVS